MITGAFDCLYNFLHVVVFDNCSDYFQSIGANEQDITRRHQSRAFFNAIVALDSAVDYLFHAESREEKNVQEFLQNLNVPALLEIREIANAVKHCERNRPDKLRAAAVAKTQGDVHIDMSDQETIGISLSISVSYFEEVRPHISAAFKFWLEKSDSIEMARAITNDPLT